MKKLGNVQALRQELGLRKYLLCFLINFSLFSVCFILLQQHLLCMEAQLS